jgi:DNA repair protein SbcC/Rad50
MLKQSFSAMHIKSLRLKNIRSYTDAHIELPSGSVLLCGDIGSGKSTILYAIEFALFGIRKPDLTGAALLRNGSREGSVELELEIDGKSIKIFRQLKRTRDDIKQETGWLVIGNEKTDLTAVELKARMLELLGYPGDLVTKHKDLIYRFTVYTPQEEMKAILFEDREMRQNTLRKVFGIDKYKRIRENCIIYCKELRSRMRLGEAQTMDLDEKERQLRDYETERESHAARVAHLTKDEADLKLAVERQKQDLSTSEQSMKEIVEAKRQLAAIEARIAVCVRQHAELGLDRTRNQLSMLEKELGNADPETGFSERIAALDHKKAECEKELSGLISRKGSLMEQERAALETIRTISGLDVCPLCRQDVTLKHKESIRFAEEAKSAGAKDSLRTLASRHDELLQTISGLKIEIDGLRGKEKQSIVLAQQKKRLMEWKDRCMDLEKTSERLKTEIGDENQKRSLLLGKASSSEAEDAYKKAKAALETLQQKQQSILQEIASEKSHVQQIVRSIDRLSPEIARLREVREQMKALSDVHVWLDSTFIHLVALMEKHVMVRIHREFEGSFVSSCVSLLEDETISARLDEEYTPIIQQNGHDIDLGHLSGGEKTSVALAYRLALNRVINDFVSNIKTRDMIILDEPTDGFSDEQLDRVREVLEELRMKQMIIVSHEQKVEGFVDHIIRVSKRGHVSDIKVR